ncbi:MAG TPA: RNA methyltransferase [Solirubrobacteraceae bacterium]|nr:RNA methyltransferase [Solirubrobacteraceae bacterium]
MTITSAHNSHLVQLRKLSQRRRARELAGRFVAEGEDLIAAADAAGWPAAERYCAAGSGLTGTEVEPELLAAVSELGSGTRALAVYETRWAARPAGPLCVSLHAVADPGNVGTILRSAVAFGAASVAIGPGTADPYGPKAVRASMGAVFEVPLARVDQITQLPAPTVALVADDGVPLYELTLGAGPLPHATLMVGAEREGLPPALVDAADHVARIPIVTHSLNAAMAATVALYEVARRMPRT